MDELGHKCYTDNFTNILIFVERASKWLRQQS